MGNLRRARIAISFCLGKIWSRKPWGSHPRAPGLYGGHQPWRLVEPVFSDRRRIDAKVNDRRQRRSGGWAIGQQKRGDGSLLQSQKKAGPALAMRTEAICCNLCNPCPKKCRLLQVTVPGPTRQDPHTLERANRATRAIR